MGMEEQLLAVGPLDGRYADKVAPLQPITSEFGLIDRRVQVGVAWVGILGSGILPDVAPLSGRAQEALRQVSERFTIDDAVAIKRIEQKTNHDANAVVRWLKNTLGRDDNLQRYAELVHFGGTSEDTNNLAFALQVRDARDVVHIPETDQIIDLLDTAARTHASLPMLARTHGQAASPTTYGKEMAVYANRLDGHSNALSDIVIRGKFNGATGNYSAASFAYPEVDWVRASRRLVASFGMEYNGTTTQIEPHDWMARYFTELALGNSIMTDLARDMWSYISYNEVAQKVTAGEDGSSAMPNKVNPIDFENAEANFGLANATLVHLAGKLPISRMQRDLSDSSAQRAIGEAFGHTLIGHLSMQKGLKKSDPNAVVMAQHLDENWAVLMEPVQTIMRRYEVTGAYDIIKEASRGKSIGPEEYRALVEGLEIPDVAKSRLRDLTPSRYIGRAAEIALIKA